MFWFKYWCLFYKLDLIKMTIVNLIENLIMNLYNFKVIVGMNLVNFGIVMICDVKDVVKVLLFLFF